MIDPTKMDLMEAVGPTATDVSRTVVVPASGTYMVGINPVDANRFIVSRTSLNSWFPPEGQDGDVISWAEKWKYIERRKAWFRIIEISNSSIEDIEVTLIMRIM